MEAIELRLAAPEDDSALQRLADLDTRSLPPAPHLIAVRAGRIDAAISLTSAEVIADPFERTAELVELLRCRAGSMRATRPGSASLRGSPMRPRLARA